jgi:transposase
VSEDDRQTPYLYRGMQTGSGLPGDPIRAMGAEAARHLGLHARMLGRWKRAVQPIRNGAFPGHGRVSPEQEEVYRWREEHGRLRTEREICKTALGFFASESK